MIEVSERLGRALADRYVIERELGQGGMATVYLARDVRHDRQVALKVLRPELASILGADRFLAEIKTTAHLQHPHILPLHDSGEADGLVFYVMPYVEGESLRDRLLREKQLPVEEAVQVAREVADALEYAHEQGVVHRDIKPENVLLHGGHALVADFGIALAVSRTEGGTRLTETGLSLGTPAYMAPEQAMGEREITPKADIYALGCVLYEMLTGEPPFTGPTAQAIVARVMTEEPRSLTLQRRTIPAHVDAVVRRALEKLPADRFATAATFAEALARPELSLAATRPAGADVSAGRWARVRPLVLRGAPWLVAVVAVAWGIRLAGRVPRTAPSPVTRFTQDFGRGATAISSGGSPIAFAPDGSRLAYVGTDSAGAMHLFVRNLDQVEPAVVPGTTGAMQPFFSPDGRWLGFRQDGKLRKVPVAGGAAVTLCDAEGPFFGASWGDGDVIVFSQRGWLRRVPAGGGPPVDVAVPDSGRHELYRFPEILPGGRAAVFAAITDSGPSIEAVTLSDRRVTALGQSGTSPHYVTGGYLAFALMDGTLLAVTFDARRLRITGSPQPIADDVMLGPAAVAKLGVSRTGDLAYLSGSPALRELALVSRDGLVRVLPGGRRQYAAPRFSPDGRRIAVTVIDRVGRFGRIPADIWVLDIASGTFQRITYDTASVLAEWTPDGRRLVYDRSRGDSVPRLYTVRSDGSGRPEPLFSAPVGIVESNLTADGRRVVFSAARGTAGLVLWIAPLDSPAAARRLLSTPFNEWNPALSPDGRWLAYTSNETGSAEVYVRGLGDGGRTRVSTNGGGEPRWARSGREMFYRHADTVYAAPVTAGRQFVSGPPRALFGTRRTLLPVTDWDVSPDGRTFVVTRPPDLGPEDSQLHVILHWFDGLVAGRN